MRWAASSSTTTSPSCAASSARRASHGTTLPALMQAIVASDSFQKRVKIGAQTTTADRGADLVVAREGRTE